MRTVTCFASYRIVEDGWNRQSALGELRRFGFHAIWGAIPSYIEQLDPLAIRFRVEKTKPAVEMP